MTSSARFGLARRFGALVATAAMTLAVVFGIPLAPGLTVGGVETAFGQEAEQSQRKAHSVPSMSEATFRKLAEAQDFIDVRDLDGAQAVLQGMLDRCRGQKCPYNGYEIGQIHNMLGYVHFSKEDYGSAVRHYEKVLGQGEAPEFLKGLARCQLMQLCSVLEPQDALHDMEICNADPACPLPDYHLNVSKNDDEYLPIVKVAPIYPRRALRRGIEGYVLVEFVVTSEGRVRDPQVIESEPPRTFDRAAINSVLKFLYRPKKVNGEPIEVTGVRYEVAFELQDG